MDVNVAVAVGDVWMGLLWSLRSGAGAFGLGLTETLTRFLADLLLFFVNFFLCLLHFFFLIFFYIISRSLSQRNRGHNISI